MSRRVSRARTLFASAVVLMAVGSLQAAGTLGNHVGTAGAVTGGETSVDIGDYFSVYRFDVPTVGTFFGAIYDGRTPLTAANFRGYADRGDYDETFIHRSVSTASTGIGIVQAGGFAFNDTDKGYYVPDGSPVLNEPGLSNVTGTFALAKTAAGPSSGTNQWYINTADNSDSLDPETNNGGYTVFGEVLYNGMSVVGVDGGTGGIADVPTYDATTWHPHFTDLPMHRPYTNPDDVVETDLVIFSSISHVTGQTYSVVGNSNPGLVSASFTGSSLTLDVVPGGTGSAELTVRTTDPWGRWFNAVINVDVVPKAMDFDQDFDIDDADVDLLFTNLGGDPGTYDVDDDGDVDVDDIVAYVTGHLECDIDGDGTFDSVGTFRGDVNCDGAVDDDDLAMLAANAGSTGAGFGGGEITFDDIVNGTDLSLLAGDYGSPPPPGAVPEPTTMVLLAASAMTVLRRRRR